MSSSSAPNPTQKRVGCLISPTNGRAIVLLRNVERVPTAEVPIDELRQLLQAPRQFHQARQAVKA